MLLIFCLRSHCNPDPEYWNAIAKRDKGDRTLTPSLDAGMRSRCNPDPEYWNAIANYCLTDSPKRFNTPTTLLHPGRSN
ncbi:hypothetical protein H6F98_11980 [Microcoleus sp. FACHB-SPT15]|uniref:hypothetical protein n=1 Tax=Microcoleus sp. FACHB-SPT15 TaxID=2692830 RepID=UPI00178548C7|nr:hypothetical protein [Microcoleus sp. FACHB-SPT15]MBD1806166.1 hypothetical protein [Microcoleus sp. FACHB-SPT15]